MRLTPVRNGLPASAQLCRVRMALSRPHTNRNVHRLSHSLRQAVLICCFKTRRTALLSQLWDEWWKTVVVGQNVAADKPPGIYVKSQFLV